jgi:hypothetical protein
MGASRPAIKKCVAFLSSAENNYTHVLRCRYIQDKYKIETSNSVSNYISQAISRGVDIGELVLPKGTSGKVKLAPREQTEKEKEVWRPSY